MGRCPPCRLQGASCSACLPCTLGAGGGRLLRAQLFFVTVAPTGVGSGEALRLHPGGQTRLYLLWVRRAVPVVRLTQNTSQAELYPCFSCLLYSVPGLSQASSPSTWKVLSVTGGDHSCATYPPWSSLGCPGFHSLSCCLTLNWVLPEA